MWCWMGWLPAAIDRDSDLRRLCAAGERLVPGELTGGGGWKKNGTGGASTYERPSK